MQNLFLAIFEITQKSVLNLNDIALGSEVVTAHQIFRPALVGATVSPCFVVLFWQDKPVQIYPTKRFDSDYYFIQNVAG